MNAYVPLWVKSNFSFLEGASHPHELVEQAHQWGLPAIALTDRDGVYGIVQAHTKAQELGIKLLIGSELTLTEPHSSSVVVLAQNRQGYSNLCQLLSKGHLQTHKGASLLNLDDLLPFAEHLLALCTDPHLLEPLQTAFADRLYALFVNHLNVQQVQHQQELKKTAHRLKIPLVGGNEVLYHTPARQPLQDVLTCIRHGVTLPTAGTLLRPNAEHYLKTAQNMRQLFMEEPELLQRTLEIAERCTFSLTELRYRYPGEKLPQGLSETDWLSHLTYEGIRKRYPGDSPPQVVQQIKRELQLIQELDYGGYFLTMYEIVQFCRSQNIFCQGRGSAANSVVCFALGITAVDPIQLDLLFERFLSRERAEPPDIDLDIEHNRREEVIQWVYNRYGRRYAAMVANVIRYRTRSAIREVGKTLGLPLTALDRLSKLLGSRFSDLSDEALRYAGLDPLSPVHQHLLSLSAEIVDFPRHLSIHPGGFLLGHEPVDTLVPIEPGAMPGRTVIQWDKYAIEDLGLFKVDLLGLGALTQVHECFDLLRQFENKDFSLASVPHEDASTYRMISRGDTLGTFQIESRAQMSMLPRLRPKTFYDLVIEVAIVRPGPIQGDMVHPYLRRRDGLEKADYPHPQLKQVLEKTLGVPLFQEQVMKIAILVGGYTPGEADQLRRDMAAWKSSGRIERHHDKLIARMIQNNITPEFAERIFSQIRGFGEYGFPESHAASFALIAYITAYLRCHHPAAFTCSLLNAQPMGFYSPATIVEDAKRRGVQVAPIDANHSQWNCSLFRHDNTLGVRMGYRYIKGFGQNEQQIFQQTSAPYKNLEDFVRRTQLSTSALLQLAEAGAFDCFKMSRRTALWDIQEILKRRGDSLVLPKYSGSIAQFRDVPLEEQIFWDYRTSEHSTRGHPIAKLRPQLSEQNIPTAQQLNSLPDGTRTNYVGMTICRQHPATAAGVTFYTLEDETGFVNLVVWHQIFERYSVLARTALLMGVHGKIQSENGVVHFIADKLWDPQIAFPSDGTTVRSFH